jgi:hypothetical protein
MVHNFQKSDLLGPTRTLVEKFSKVLPTATYCDFGVNANWRRNPKADQTKSEGKFLTSKKVFASRLCQIHERGFFPFGSFVYFAVQSPSSRFASG